MTANSRKTLKLPRLRTKSELLKSAPELGRLLGDLTAKDTMLLSPRDKAHVLQTLRRDVSPSKTAAFDADDPSEELTEEEELRMELESVKRERAGLLQSLASLKADQGKSGRDLQSDDIRRLRKEMELKKDKVNELRQDTMRLEHLLGKLHVTSRDCRTLMPDGQPDQQTRIKGLQGEMQVLDEELIETEARHRLYQLLAERTRREHDAMAQRVQGARELQTSCNEDHAALVGNMHSLRAGREDAERDLAHLRHMCSEVQHDWLRKLKDRRKEVRDLERRQEKETAREEAKSAKALQWEAAERERQAQVMAQEEAAQLQLQALQPKLEAMEAMWFRLHSISGAETPDDVVSHWEGLRAKEENMRELVRLAEVREGRARQSMADLLKSRSTLYEASAADTATGAAAQAESEKAPDGSETRPQSSTDANSLESQIEEAIRSSDLSRKKFGRLRSICIAAQQGLWALLGRLEIALSDSPNAQAGGSTLRSPSRKFSRSGGSFIQKPKSSGSDAGAAKGTGDDGQGNTIDDDAFFPELPRLVKDVAERLSKLVAVEARLVAAMAGTEAASDAASEAPSGISSLASGFRRRTWAGPAWLEAITQAGLPMPSTPPPARRRKAAAKGGPTAGEHPDFSRILGYMGEEGEEGSSPEPEVRPVGGKGAPREETPWEDVPDRDYIKHRTMKILAKRDAALRSKHANTTASTASKVTSSESRSNSRPATAT